MSANLLHYNEYAFQVLLKKIQIKGLDQQLEPSLQNPIAKILDYYLYAKESKGVHEKYCHINAGTPQEIKLGPIIARVNKGQWLDTRYNCPRINTGIPSSIELYPKWFRGDNAVFVLIGQNGLIVVDDTIAVFKDPVVIVRNTGEMAVLESGLQCLDFEGGIHLVLYAFGVTIVIEAEESLINENQLIYTCIGSDFLDISSGQPSLLQPLLFVKTGENSSFHLVQVRQRLLVVDGNSYQTLLVDNFWFLEFNPLFKMFTAMLNRNLEMMGNEAKLPNEVIVPEEHLIFLGPLIKRLEISERSTQTVNIKFEFMSTKSPIVVFANIDEMPSSGVVTDGLTIQFAKTANAFVVTKDALDITMGVNQHIKKLSSYQLNLDNASKEMAKNHSILMFRNGFILLTANL